MIATVVLAAVAALDLSGVFPPEVKTVGVVMPASILAKAKYDRGVDALKAAGYRVKPAQRLSFDKLAPVEDRVKDFEETWMDPEVDLVLCARGGTGAEDVITRLDWAKLRTRPDQKVLGFSNITMILNAMLKEKAGHPISGSTISHMNYAAGDTFAWLCDTVAVRPHPAAKLRALKPGAFSGLPCGGHIALVRKGIEMKWNANAAGRVVFLERNNSATVEGIRKELDDILNSGYLTGAAGVIFGDVTPGTGKKDARALSAKDLESARAKIEELKRDFAAKAPCPVYDGYAYGHIPVSHAIDFRRRVSVSEDGTMIWACEDVELLSELLSIPSVSKNIAETDRAVAWMKDFLEKRGVWCAVETCPSDGRKALYAATQKGLRNPDFTIVTHLDVVDAPPEMFKPRVEGNRLYARGASDTKSQAFCAARILEALNGRASVGCVFASDEEIGSATTAHMVKLGYGIPGKMVLVLDAAQLRGDIRYACKGNAYYRVTAVGKSGHSSRPEACDNALYRLAEAALAIRDRFPSQEPGEWGDVASVTIAQGGDAENRIPGVAEMTVNVRFVEPDGFERHRRTIEKVTGLKTDFLRGTMPGIGPSDTPILLRFRDAVKRAYPGRSCELTRAVAATDARCFAQFGKPLPALGMNQDGGHTDCEWCETTDIAHFYRMIIDFIDRETQR